MIGPLPPGEYRIDTRSGGAENRSTVRLVAGEDLAHDLVLEAPRSIFIHVTGDDGRPVSGAQVTSWDGSGEEVRLDSALLRRRFKLDQSIEPALTWEEFERRRRRTNRSGKLLLRSLPIGPYRLRIEAAGYGPATAEAVVTETRAARVEMRLTR